MGAAAAALVVACTATTTTSSPAGASPAGTSAVGASPTTAASPLDTTVVRVAAQPVLALNQWYLADKLGYFKDNGVSIKLVNYYQSGAPEVEAGLSGDWDVAFMGELPTITGGAAWDMQTIGFFGNEDAAHAMYVRPSDNVNASDPASNLRGQNVLYTQGSAGQVFLEACLKSWGLTPNDVKLVNLAPADLVTAFKAGNGILAQAYPPFSFQLAAAGYKNICDTTKLGVDAYPTMVTTPAFARDHPDVLARFVEAVFRANELYINDEAKAESIITDFYKDAGVTQSAADIKATIGVYQWATLPAGQQIFQSGKGKASAAVMVDLLVRGKKLDATVDVTWLNEKPIDAAVAYRASQGR